MKSNSRLPPPENPIKIINYQEYRYKENCNMIYQEYKVCKKINPLLKISTINEIHMAVFSMYR